MPSSRALDPSSKPPGGQDPLASAEGPATKALEPAVALSQGAIERLGWVLFEAHLALGEGRAGSAPEALRVAAGAAGVPESELQALRDLEAALGNAPLSAEREREAQRLLARGYRAVAAQKTPDERRRFERRVALATARRLAAAASLVAGLEAEGPAAEADLEGLLAGALEEAIALAGGDGPKQVSGWLEAMERLEVDDVVRREVVALAALALGPGSSRAARAILLAEGTRAPLLARFVSALPELGQQPEILRGLLESVAVSARACATRALLNLGEEGEEILAQALGSMDARTRTLRAAELYRDLRAAFVARALARASSHAEAASWEEMLQSVLEAAQRVDFLSELGTALVSRIPEVALRLHEAAFRAGLDLIETHAIEPRSLEAMQRSASTLVRSGQGSAVAAQLLGVGAQILSANGSSLAVWAKVNLGIARQLGSTSDGAILFYVNLASIFARAPERLHDFGDAAPLLFRIQRRLRGGHDGVSGASSGVLARLELERHLQGLAEDLARADSRGPGSPKRPEREVGPQGAGAMRPLSIAIQAVDGAEVHVPSRAIQTVRVLTGFEILRSAFLFILGWLGYKTSGRIEISPSSLALEQVSRFLGQTTRRARQEISPDSLLRVQRTEKAPRHFLVLGLVALVGLTWFGVSIAFDGIHIGDAVLIAAGLGFVLVGLLADAALYWIFQKTKESTTFALFLRDRLRPVRLVVPRASADRIATALFAMRGAHRPQAEPPLEDPAPLQKN
jgi:hypothetical protein